MSKTSFELLETIGKTPLVRLCGFERENGLSCRVLAKLEMFNLTGSVKDRAIFGMIQELEKSGMLKQGGTIIEPTSGNTGLSIAAIGAIKGYKVILTMPESMSIERRSLLKLYGAQLVLTRAELGMKGAIDKASQLQKELDGAVSLFQFENPFNALAHESTTAVEIIKDCLGKIDIFVAGVGTGGTFSGVSRFLKRKDPNIKSFAVEPFESAVLSGDAAFRHGIQGIGAGFVPKNFDYSVCDGILKVSTQQAISSVKALAKTDGLAVGISSGAALHAAFMLAKEKENARKTIVTIFPDSTMKYLSMLD